MASREGSEGNYGDNDLYGDDDSHDDDDIGIPPAITTSLEAPFVPSPTPSSSPLASVHDLPQPFSQRL